MKVCAFTTCDEGYVQNAVISLLTIKKWNQHFDLFILSRKLSDTAKEFAYRYDISVVEIDLDHIFSCSFTYPIECYYLFSGPQFFLDLGYEFSIYIDGDVYCNGPININWSSVNYFAGVSIGKIEDLLSEDLENIYQIWDCNYIPDYRIQTGFLVFANNALHEIDFSEKIRDLYIKSLISNIPRKGDDSLFSLFQLVHSDFKPNLLNEKFNYIIFDSKINEKRKYLTHLENIICECIIFHFTGSTTKPWQKYFIPTCYTEKYFRKKWQHCLINSLSYEDISRYFPQFYNFTKESEVKFYWWGSTNVGDLVTAYFLKSICNISNLESVRASEKDFLLKRESLLSRASSFLLKKFNFLRSEEKSVKKIIISTGSVMRLCSPNVSVYGSGIRSKRQEIQKGNVEFVRGPLTRKALLDIKCECPSIYGDPALLMSRYYQPKLQNKKYKLGIIPHFTEYDEVYELYHNVPDIKVINMGCGDVEKVIDEICLCYATVSSSLHGIVFSHSYSVPVRWIKFSNKIFGDDTKYRDYFASIGRPNEIYIDAIEFNFLRLEYLLDSIEIYNVEINIDLIEDSMFFNSSGLKRTVFWLGEK